MSKAARRNLQPSGHLLQRGSRTLCALPEVWSDDPSTVLSVHGLRGRKPAPDVFLVAAVAMGVGAALSAVFEDAVAGVAAARAWCVWLGCRGRPRRSGRGAAQPRGPAGSSASDDRDLRVLGQAMGCRWADAASAIRILLLLNSSA